jgi:hypothetical protein
MKMGNGHSQYKYAENGAHITRAQGVGDEIDSPKAYAHSSRSGRYPVVGSAWLSTFLSGRMNAWDCAVVLCVWTWYLLAGLYGMLHSLGIAGCMVAVAVGWRANRWGLSLTSQYSWNSDGIQAARQAGRRHPAVPKAPPQWLLGCLLQIGSTILTAIAMIALVRAMIA